MLSTGSLKDAPFLASSDSDIFALVAANGRADGCRPRKLGHNSLRCPTMSADVNWRTLRATRANRVCRADEKHIRTTNTVIAKNW